MSSSSAEINFLLSDARNPENYSKLIRLVYGELRQIAAHYFRGERPDHTLQPTALVHELYVRLLNHGPARYENRGHFFAVAARAMRQILVEHARARKSMKRGGGSQNVPLEDVNVPGAQTPDYFAMAELLDRLEEFDERACRVVEMRVFGGLTSEDIAAVLSIGESTARKDWANAKLWLERELRRGQQ